MVTRVCSLEPSARVPSAPYFCIRKGRSTANCWRRSRAAAEVSALALASRRRWNSSRRAAESAAVIGGPSGFQTNAGSFSSTQAPLIRLLLASSSSALPIEARTTGPLTIFPPVPAVQAQLYASSARRNGAASCTEIGPRSQVTPKG